LTALCGSSAEHTAAHVETLARMKDVSLLRWARSTVASRAFRLPADECLGGASAAAAAEAALVPVADLLDHRPGTPARWSRDGVTGAFRFHTDAVVAAGAAFYADYGDNGNSDTVLAHGFALWPNAADRYVLTLTAEDLHTVRARRPVVYDPRCPTQVVVCILVCSAMEALSVAQRVRWLAGGRREARALGFWHAVRWGCSTPSRWPRRYRTRCGARFTCC
jgi:hypothetical protein